VTFKQTDIKCNTSNTTKYVPDKGKILYNHPVVETVLLPKYYSGAQIDEMGGECSTYGERRVQGFGGET